MSAPASSPPPAAVRVPAGTTAGAAVRARGPALQRPERRGGRPRRRRGIARPGLEPGRRRRGRAGRRRHRRRAAASSGTRPRTSSPRRCSSCGPTPSWASARRSPTGSTTTSTSTSPFTPDDLVALEAAMKKIIKAGQRFARRRFDSIDDARKELADEPYKLELIDLKGARGARRGRGRRIRRAHRSTTTSTRIPARPSGRTCAAARTCPPPGTSRRSSSPAAPRRTGGASEKNPQLQRIYGTAWESQEALDAHLERLAEAERRDHRTPRRRAGPVLLPRRDRLGAGGVPPQGRHHPPGAGGLLPARPRGGGLRVRQHPAHHEGPALRDLRAPRLVLGRHVPGHAPRRGARRRRQRCASPARTTTSSR